MQSHVTADVICVFEHTGTSVDAQSFIMARLREVAGVTNLTFNNVRIVRWSDPETNRPRQFEHPDGKMYFRYNAQVSLTFTITGGHAEAHQWILDRLYEEEESTYMNVQSINLYVNGVG